MATVFHFQPWISRDSQNFNGSLSVPYRYVQRLTKEGLIKPVEVYPYIHKTFRHNQFYALKPGHKISNFILEHQFGLIDVLMAFIYLYPEYEIDIKFTPKLEAAGKVYKPDALISMVSPIGKKYDFIIEFERTRNPIAVYNEKLLKNEQMPPFKDMGLS